MTNSLPWKDPPIFKFGKPSISRPSTNHGYVSHNQRVPYFTQDHVVRFPGTCMISSNTGDGRNPSSWYPLVNIAIEHGHL